jgi:hypothetical protein
MRPRAKAWLAAAAFAIIAGGSQAQQLWQHTSVGMTVDQVKAGDPSAVAPDGAPSRLADGSLGLLQGPALDLVGKQFSVTYYFKGDRLTRVHLSHRGPPTAQATARLFEDLRLALESKYGAPVRLKRSGELMSMYQATWLAGATTIDLTGIFASTDGLLVVSYSGRAASEAGKL